MINIAQTLVYAQVCHANNLPIIPRSKQAMRDLRDKLRPADRTVIDGLLETPHTASAYLELIRCQMSLRALGLLETHHPSAMINVANFQRMLAEFTNPETVHSVVVPYNIGDLSMYGSLLTMSGNIYKKLEDANKLDDVFANSNLSRLLSLHEYVECNFDNSIVAEVVTPVKLPYMKSDII